MLIKNISFLLCVNFNSLFTSSFEIEYDCRVLDSRICDLSKEEIIHESAEQVLIFYAAIPREITAFNLKGKNIPIFNSNFGQQFPNLQEIHLVQSNIERIHKNSFSECSKLTWLDLSYNNLSYLDENLFQNLTNLETLSLNFNNFHHFNVNLLKALVKLELLNFHSNHLLEFDSSKLKNLNLLKLNVVTFYDNYILCSRLMEIKADSKAIFGYDNNFKYLKLREREYEPEYLNSNKNEPCLNLDQWCYEVDKVNFEDKRNILEIVENNGKYEQVKSCLDKTPQKLLFLSKKPTTTTTTSTTERNLVMKTQCKSKKYPDLEYCDYD